MDRIERLRQGLSKQDLGIEIGPWFNPVVPKREGYNVLVVDYFDTAELRRRAVEDPGISDADAQKIEEVDFSGSLNDLLSFANDNKITGSVDYILSSHNIEHIPDPISFFINSAEILKPDGMLVMAIPDKRTCFDYFRPHSTTGEVLQSFVEKRTRPSFSQIFSHNAYHAYNYSDDTPKTSWAISEKTNGMRLVNSDLLSWYELANSTLDPLFHYVDAHCWAFTPSSFQLIILELSELGLIHFNLESIDAPGGGEFFVRLRGKDKALKPAPANAALRNELLFQIMAENAQNSRFVHQANAN